MGKTTLIPFTIALLMLTVPLSGSIEHPTYPDFAQPIYQFYLNKYSITFHDDQSADSITITITDDAIYRYVQTSFDGQNWIQRTIQNSTQCSFHPDDPSHTWLTGTCNLSIPMAASDFPSLLPGTTAVRNYITAYSCDEVLFPFLPFRIGWDCHDGWQILQFNATLAEAPDPCEGVDCDDLYPCTADSCSGGTCSHVPVTACVNGDSCCPSGCTYQTDSDCEEVPELEAIDVIGPHEFWTHENAVNGDYVGYVKFFDMRDFTPVFSEVSDTSGGGFSINPSTGLITVSDIGMLSPGSTYTYRVKIEEPGIQEGETDVIIHVADEDDVIYLDSSAPSGGDGSYENPFDDINEDIGISFDEKISTGNYQAGKVYLLRRGRVFGGSIRIQTPGTSASNPIVIGAYGQGNRPILDNSWAGVQIGEYDATEATGYIYIQNLEVRNADLKGISNGAYAPHHHVTLLDDYVHGSGGEGIWIWSNHQHDFNLDLDWFLINCESSYNGYAGTKLYAGGVEVYNYYGHHNVENGFRFVLSGKKVARGILTHDNGIAGIQLRSNETSLEYFKSYNNYMGIEVWFNHDDPAAIPLQYLGDSFIRKNITVENGYLWGNDRGIVINRDVGDVLVKNISSYGNEEFGVGVLGNGNTENIIIKNSRIYDNGEQGILTDDKDQCGKKSYNVYIQNNEIYGNGAESIRLEYVDGAYVENNVIYGNAINQIVETATATNVYKSGNQFL